MKPTRLTRFFALACGFFLLHGVLASRPASGAIGLLGLLLLVQARFAFERRIGALELTARRRVEADLPRPEEPVLVEVEVRGRSEGLFLRFGDTLPADAQLAAGPARTGGPLPASIRYTCTFEEAGVHEWTDLSVQIEDPLGLWEAEASLPAEASVQVSPSRQALRRARRRAEREDLDLRQENLEEVLFEDLELTRVRPYEPADRPRDIDWKRSAEQQELLARHMEEAERKRSLVVVVDEPAPADDGALDRLEDVRRLAMETVGLALDRRVAVGCVLASGTRVRATVHPRTGGEAMRRIRGMMRSTEPASGPRSRTSVRADHPGWLDAEREFLQAVGRWRPSDEADLGPVLREVAREHGEARTTFLVLTDLVDGTHGLVRDLADVARHRPHVILGTLPPRTRDRRVDEPRLDDLESAYRREVRRAQAIRLLERRGCQVLELPAEPTFGDVADETERARPRREIR